MHFIDFWGCRLDSSGATPARPLLLSLCPFASCRTNWEPNLYKFPESSNSIHLIVARSWPSSASSNRPSGDGSRSKFLSSNFEHSSDFEFYFILFLSSSWQPQKNHRKLKFSNKKLNLKAGLLPAFSTFAKYVRKVR